MIETSSIDSVDVTLTATSDRETTHELSGCEKRNCAIKNRGTPGFGTASTVKVG